MRFSRPPLSDDAKMVLAVKRVATQHRLTRDPFHLLRHEKPDWTRERWERAVSEVENSRLRQVQPASGGRMVKDGRQSVAIAVGQGEQAALGSLFGATVRKWL